MVLPASDRSINAGKLNQAMEICIKAEGKMAFHALKRGLKLDITVTILGKTGLMLLGLVTPNN